MKEVYFNEEKAFEKYKNNDINKNFISIKLEFKGGKFMKEFLNKIRTSDSNMEMKDKIINTIFIFLLGIILGAFSKWLDNLSINDAIWWQHILGILDLRNVFSLFGIWIFIATAISVFSKTPLRASLNVFLFFVGMTVSYHIYTICFSGFNPMKYMMIWYITTLITPLLAFICWYSKGNGIISFMICSMILVIMLLCSFGIGMWYFDFKSIIDTLLFIGTVGVLYTDAKKSIYSLLSALLLAFCLRIVLSL